MKFMHKENSGKLVKSVEDIFLKSVSLILAIRFSLLSTLS